MQRFAAQARDGTYAGWLVAAILASAGCQSGLDAPARERAELSKAEFACFVQPVLTRDCSPLLCHGDGLRFYRLYAPNRLRRSGTERDRAKPIRLRELQANYVASRSMTSRTDPTESLLIKKPLDQKLDGFFHGGATKFGQGDVYAGRSESETRDLNRLEQWVRNKTIATNPDQTRSCLSSLAKLACEEGGDETLGELRRWLGKYVGGDAGTTPSRDAGVIAECEQLGTTDAP